MKLIECVPNFSEGRNQQTVEALRQVVKKIGGVRLLDASADADHNRCVLTLMASPEGIVDGAMAVAEEALRRIDMRRHEGIHPRIGAVDVVPFIPLGEATMAEAVTAARYFGHEFAKRTGVPVYFYGEAALKPERRQLPDVRRGGYEGLAARLKDPHWYPDAGEAVFNERWGATAVGARIPLVAFNVNLDSTDLSLAREIACAVRESSGGFPCVKAIGLFLAGRKKIQVSMNLTDYRKTSLRTVFDLITKMARDRGVSVLYSELIGLLPRDALADATPEYLRLIDFSEDRIIESHIQF
ncbi:MAG: glutamate formimidoyltransferase [Syntrophales bacterium]|jgi:glutamate formiminotransferase|nr:glutamate formimidoyltransferase [Syntrophales bacterium]